MSALIAHSAAAIASDPDNSPRFRRSSQNGAEYMARKMATTRRFSAADMPAVSLATHLLKAARPSGAPRSRIR